MHRRQKIAHVARYHNTKSMQEMAEELGCATSTIRNFARVADVTLMSTTEASELGIIIRYPYDLAWCRSWAPEFVPPDDDDVEA